LSWYKKGEHSYSARKNARRHGFIKKGGRLEKPCGKKKHEEKAEVRPLRK